jgi:hypothetical protein
MASNAEWGLGYARQAQADFRMYQTLEGNPSVEVCHRLQFLQMACEKIVKASLCYAGDDPAAMQSSHAYVKRYLPAMLRQEASLVSLPTAKAREVQHRGRRLAEEIDVLAPAVKRGGQRPDNCEYPWEDNGGALHVPLDWSFNPAQLIVLPAGRTILKLIEHAINRRLP